jgi:DNA-binding IclR family transcriptional regulator
LTQRASLDNIEAVKNRTSGRKVTTAKRTYSAPALEKGMTVVELLADVPGGLTISEIATRLQRSVNEVFRVIVVMESREWLSKDVETNRYTVSFQTVKLALRATPAQSLASIAGPSMEELALATNQSCHLVVRAGGRGLVIQRQENAGLQGGFALRAGADVDLVKSCSGHVLLAFVAQHLYAGILRQLPRPMGWPIKKLERRLAEVRRRGYEIQPSVKTAGVTDISFPIFGFAGKVAAALTVPYLRLIDGSAPTTVEETRILLQKAAGTISSDLGWSFSR